MSRKLVFSIFLLIVFFQASWVSQAYRPNTHIKIHDSNTVYGVDVLGKTKSFKKRKGSFRTWCVNSMARTRKRYYWKGNR